jgi:hypothetical protein
MSWLAPAGTRPAGHRLPGPHVRTELGGARHRGPKPASPCVRAPPDSLQLLPLSAQGPAPGINTTGTPRGWCDHC